MARKLVNSFFWHLDTTPFDRGMRRSRIKVQSQRPFSTNLFLFVFFCEWLGTKEKTTIGHSIRCGNLVLTLFLWSADVHKQISLCLLKKGLMDFTEMFGFSSPVLDDKISDLDFWNRHKPKLVKEALTDLKMYHKYWVYMKHSKHESPSWKYFEGNLGNCGGFRTRRRAEFWPFSHLTNSQHLTAVEVRTSRKVILAIKDPPNL